jgi:hypothetical protein
LLDPTPEAATFLASLDPNLSIATTPAEVVALILAQATNQRL